MEMGLLVDHPDDISRITQWYYDEWARHFPHVTQEMVSRKISEKAVNRDQFPLAIVIHEGNALIAVAELKYRENANYPEYAHWLGGVYVTASHRGRNIVSKLITQARSLSQSMGVKTLYLQCATHHVALYKKHGFEACHPTMHGDAETTIMACSLRHPS